MSTVVIDADVTDAKPGSPAVAVASSTGPIGVEEQFTNLTIADDCDVRYRMDRRHRGKFLIINNMDFLPQTKMGHRAGSQVDADSLEKDFERLGFDVTVRKNRTILQMLDIVTRAVEDTEYNQNSDCFGLAVLTHGDNNVLFGVDNIIAIENLIAPIKDCKDLVGKPKILIFQACRGAEYDKGNEVFDAPGAKEKMARKLPLEADFLYAYSTVPGYYSWRNQTRGSWFIQALHAMMDKYIFKIDFVKLLTRVNHQVAYDFESTGQVRGMKQISSIVSMLTRDLYFPQKKSEPEINLSVR